MRDRSSRRQAGGRIVSRPHDSCTMNLNHVTLPVHDVERGVLFYEGMGCRLIVDARPRSVRLEGPTGDATPSLHYVDGSSSGDRGVVVYFECDDVDRA